MIYVGLGGIGVALILAGAFVESTVRADARVHAVDPAATSRFVGRPRALAVAAVAVAVASVLLLAVHVVGLWL